MTDAKPAGLPAKESTRPAYGCWTPGDYMCQCVGCRSIFIGDKRALHCADCAYALPDTKAALDTERAARLAAEARVKVLEDALRKWAIAAVHQLTYGGGTERVGWRCRICQSDWSEVGKEIHEDGCLLNDTALKETANG